MVPEGMVSEVRPQAHFYPRKWPHDVEHGFYDAESKMNALLDVSTTQMALLNHGNRCCYDIYIHERNHTVELKNNGHGWDCDDTDKELRYAHLLFNLWWAGVFHADGGELFGLRLGKVFFDEA